MRVMRRLDPLHAVAVASLLFGMGMGLAAFVPLGWPLVATVGVLSVAMAMYSPMATTAVSHMAPAELRGRYMGAWTLLWTAGGSALGPLLGGALLTESVFSWPGIGKFTVDSIMKSDFPIVQGIVLLVAVVFVMVNLSADLIYAFLDPRIKYSSKTDG